MNKNNNKSFLNQEKYKKSPVRSSLFKINNINENNRVNRKSACDVKKYKECTDIKILQKNNININNHFIYGENM